MNHQRSARPRRRATFATSAALACLAAAIPAAADERPSFATEEQELLYFWGTTFGQQLEAAHVVDAADIEWVLRGLREQALGKAPAFRDEYPSLLNNHLVKRARDAATAEAVAGREYIRQMGKEPGAVTTASGLVYRELAPGAGDRPTAESTVKVHYVGTLRNGKVFDSSRERGAPLDTRLTAVIKCWSEGVPLMKAGGKARITCPPELGYGDRDNARIPGGSALTFEIELLEVGK